MPNACRRSSSTRSRSGSTRVARPARPAPGLGSRRRRTSSSVWRTDSSWPMTESRTRSWISGGEAAERSAVTLGQAPVGDRRLDARRQVEKAQRVGDGRASSTDPAGDVVLAEAELVDELPIGLGRLERVEVLALEVLDERELELVTIGELADDRRDPLEAGGLRGTKAALAGDELVAVDGLGDQDRLEDAVLRMLSVSEARPASSKRFRGWCGFGRTRSIGISMAPPCPGLRCGISEARPRPRPWDRSGRTVTTPRPSSAPRPRAGGSIRPSRVRSSVAQAAAYAAAPVGVGRVARDRLAVARRLRQPDVPRDDRVEDAVPEVAAHLGGDLGGQVRPASYIVRTTPLMARSGLRWSRTSSRVASSWVSPSRA